MDVPRSEASYFAFSYELNYADVFGAALEAFWKAARSYDPDAPASFRTWARQKVRHGIQDWARTADALTRTMRLRVRAVQSARQAFYGRHGRYPSAAETARTTNLTPAQVLDAGALGLRAAALPLQPDTAAALHHDPFDAVDSADAFNAMVHRLPRQHAIVIRGYFQHDLGPSTLAAILRLSESRIHQLRHEALDILRDHLSPPVDAGVSP